MARVRTRPGNFRDVNYQFKRCILENVLQHDYTEEDYKDGKEFFEGCAFCGNKRPLRQDHLVPVALCGDFIRYNVVPACKRCDDSKGRKEYQDWMLNSNSPGSLKARGLTDKQIRQRIKLIEEWQHGYKPKTEAKLFGGNKDEYEDLLRQMGKLCRKAKELVSKVKPE